MKNLQESGQSRMIDRKPCLAQLITSRQRMGKISVRVQSRKSVHDVFGQIKRFAGLPHCTATTKGNNVGGHCCTKTSVTSINFLDHAFPTIPTGEIEIDIGPTFSTFTKKALK